MFGEKREQPGNRGYGHGAPEARAGTVVPVAVAGEQTADGRGEFGHLRRGEMEDGAEGLVLLPLGRRLVSVSQPVLVTLVLQSAGESGDLFTLFLVGPVGGIPPQPPWPRPAALVRRFLDEAVPGQLTQVKGAESGAVAEAGSGFGGGEGAGFGEQVQQGDAHGMVGEGPAGTVRQGIRGLGLTDFIAHFAKGATLQRTWQADGQADSSARWLRR